MIPDSPHMASVFVLLFASLMGWLFHVGLRRCLAPGSDSRRHLWPLIGWGGCWVAALLLNAATLGSAGVRWEALARQTAQARRAALAGARNGSQLLLAGRAARSPSAPVAGSSAYVVELDAEGGRRPASGHLAVELEDGIELVELPEGTVRWNWRYQRTGYGRSFLDVGDPVIVLGTVRHGRSLLAAGEGARQVWVEAELVRRGSAADFSDQARAQARHPWPRLLAWASLLAALVLAALPVVAWARRRR